VSLSIRWRLTLWNTLALAVLLTCFAGVVYGLFHHALFEQTDRALQVGFGLLREDPRIESATDEGLHDWIAEFKEHQNLLCVIYRADGTVHDRTAGLKEVSMPPLPAGAHDRGVYDERLPNIGRHRVMFERMRFGGRDFVVMLLAPLEVIDQELAEIRNVLVVAGSAALLLSAGLAYVMARKALAPVSKLRRATDAITADRLDQRLPVANPHDELGLLTRTINAMLARLDRSFAEVRRFTADASHELRTPLTAIRSVGEVALQRSLSPEAYREVIGSMLEEVDRLTRLVENLLLLTRAEAGRIPLTRATVDLRELVAGVADGLRVLTEEKNQELTVELGGPVAVECDATVLRQGITNLLHNAIKFTPNKGVIRVAARSATNGGAVIEVEDSGPGIPTAHQERVFERFYRVDQARSRDTGGMGLGLAIARWAVEANGGRIELESVAGQGTLFRVVLPRS